jgi:hypothetical protein
MHRTRKSATKEDPLSLIAQRRKDEMIETLKAPATAKRFRSFLAGARFRSHIFTLRKWANSGGGGESRVVRWKQNRRRLAVAAAIADSLPSR